jgi:hypothetical protein
MQSLLFAVGEGTFITGLGMKPSARAAERFPARDSVQSTHPA